MRKTLRRLPKRFVYPYVRFDEGTDAVRPPPTLLGWDSPALACIHLRDMFIIKKDNELNEVYSFDRDFDRLNVRRITE